MPLSNSVYHNHTQREQPIRRYYTMKWSILPITINEQAATFPYQIFRNDFTLIFCYLFRYYNINFINTLPSFGSLYYFHLYFSMLASHHRLNSSAVAKHTFPSLAAVSAAINGCFKSIGVRFYSVCHWIAWQSDNNVVLSVCHCTLMWISFQNTPAMALSLSSI